MRTGAYLAASGIGCVDHLGLEDPGLLYKFSECLMVHVLPWNLEVLMPGLAKHSARMLVTSGGGNNNTSVP